MAPSAPTTTQTEAVPSAPISLSEAIPSTLPSDTLDIKDNRTGKTYTIKINKNSIAATDFLQCQAPESAEHPEEQRSSGLRILDNGFQNTAVKESKVTYVDGQRGIIQYRGIPIEQLVGKVTFLDTSHLLIWGRLPNALESRAHQENLYRAALLPTDTTFDVIRAFPSSSPPLPMIIAGLSAFQAAHPTRIPAHVGANLYAGNISAVDEEIVRAMGALSTISAMAYCHSTGRTFRAPDESLSYIPNFLHMVGMVDPATDKPKPETVDRMERLWTLVADHEMTCSTAAFLQTASALPDPYSCMISAYSAAYGILHGGAIEVAFKNIRKVGSVENAQAKIDGVKAGKERLFGYGHRLYKVTDPRSVFIREILKELGEEIQGDELLSVAFEIDRIASNDEYFIKRRLHPNADLFASFAYKALGFAEDFILPLSFMARMQGFMAHWREAMAQSPRIWRPQQLYTGKIAAMTS